jgi:hypothetical protein
MSDFRDFKKKDKGQICELIEHQYTRFSKEHLESAIRGDKKDMSHLTPIHFWSFIDLCENISTTDGFLQKDTVEVFDQFTKIASIILKDIGVSSDLEETKFKLFNHAILIFALKAHNDSLYRQKIIENVAISTQDREIKGTTFPWSGVGLLYPIIGVMSYADVYQGSSPWTVMLGYGIAQLGYLLIAAGVIKGTFNVFRLQKRSHVFGAAVVCLIVGFYVTNLYPMQM